MRYDTILCDMDGTLFDTERIYHAGWNEAGVSDDIYRQMIGRDHGAIRALLERSGFNAEKVFRAKREYCDELLAKYVPEKDGMERTMKWLKENGYHTAIATSSAREVAEHYLKVSDTTGYFEKIISGHSLEHGKPAPDIYLMAAEQMHAEPSRCVVVEDSRNGVLAGRAAGMKTVLIPDEFQPDEETIHAADIILHSLDELPVYLRMLNGELSLS